MSLLGFLVRRMGCRAEPVATLALAYVLRSSPDIARAFIKVVSRNGIASFTPGRIAAEEQHGGCRPDLTIRDGDEEVRIFVENKFGADLMEGQPVAYLKALPDEASSLVVFIVPQQRMYDLWNELKEKCRQSEVDIRNESKGNAIYWASAGRRNLAITSWKQVLGTLERTADSNGHADLLADIIQLRGLTDQMDADMFLPLREGEVTDVNVPRRMINYTGLINEIVGRLETDGVADTKGLRIGCAYTYAGRFLRLHEKFEVWLGVHQEVWRDRGISPLWIATTLPGVEGGLNRAEQLFNDAHVKDGWLYIPIRLTAGVDRDCVIDDAVQQVHNIADRLLEAFPGG